MERRVRRGAGAGQGVAGRWGDKGAPCPGSQRSGWPTGRLASWLVNVQMNAAVLPHSSPEPCLASSSCWPSSTRRQGFLPVTDTQGALEKGQLVGGGRLDVNSPTQKNIWGGGGEVDTNTAPTRFWCTTHFTPCLLLLPWQNPTKTPVKVRNCSTLCSRLNTHPIHK